jgi:hypothetical protein
MNSQSSQINPLATKADFLNRVWTDASFAERLNTDPKSAFAELGGQIPDNLDVRVVQDTAKVMYLHIPSPPPEGEVSDEDLLNAQGGTTWFCAGLVVGGAISVAGTVTIIETT